MDPLDVEEIVKVTGRVMPSAQKRELEHLGVPFMVRRDGSLWVERDNPVVRRLTGVVADATVSTSGPDFGALTRRRK